MKSLYLAVACMLVQLCLAAAASADVGEGVRLLRQARQSLEQGDAEAALVLLDQAYIELPFSAEEEFVYHERADAYAADGRYDEALSEYGKALNRPSAHRARFNSGVLQSRLAEEALEAAGVPLDPAGIPADADPAPLIEAIELNIPRLEEARMQFMEALRLSPDAEARESVAALTERLDDLAEMLEDLRNREQEENEDEEQDDEGDENQDDEEKDQEEQDDSESGDEEQPPEDGEQNQEQDPADQEPPEDQPAPEPQEQRAAQPRPELSAAEVADLMEQLEELEEMAMELDRQRRAQDQVDVEKDW